MKDYLLKNIFIALFFFISISIFSQGEKRLALVIGNANYVKGELKNPVNDARLIASTLDSLDFDVILKENLITRREMLLAIDEFGEKREKYDVAFVYYAGHGIQINNQNYLLPTKEIYEDENDVLDYAVSVQKIMRYLETKADQVNILILDACRDNPFESNWKSTRSLKGGGLAKLPAPTGSLIAFSTDSGQTAPDGDGENSVYSLVLAHEIITANISIEQVFKNVRTKVLELTNKAQRPVEESKLTGSDFYMVPLDYVKIIDTTAKLFSSGKNYDALELITGLINNKNYKKSSAFRLRSLIYSELNKYEKALIDINKYIELNEENDNSYSLNGKVISQKELINIGYISKGQLHHKFKFYENAIESYSKVITNNVDEFQKLHAMFLRGYAYQEFANTFYNTPQYLRERGYLELAIKDYKEVIKNETKYASVYSNLANAYSNVNEHNLALQAIEMALEIEPNNVDYLVSKANKLGNINENGKALDLYNQIVDLYPSNPSNYYNRAYFYARIGEHEKALIDYGKSEDITNDQNLLKKLYFYRAKSYNAIEDHINEILDLNRVIIIDSKYFNAYKNRGLAYGKLKKFSSAIRDLQKTIELAPSLYSHLYTEIALYYEDINEYEKAKENFEKAISAVPEEFDNYLFFSEMYIEIGKYQNAINVLNLFNKNNPQSLEGNIKLGRVFNKLKDFEKAIISFNKALLIDPNNIEANTQLGFTKFNQYKFDEALPYFNKVVKLKPNDQEANLYLAMTYMIQRKDNLLEEFIQKLSEDYLFPEFKLFGASLYITLGIEDQDKKYLKKALFILKQYDQKNGYSSYSSILQFTANLMLEDVDQALLNISQAISSFGKDSYSNEAIAIFNNIKTISGKAFSSLTVIDLYLFRSWVYFYMEDEGSCKDLNYAIELIESRNIDKGIEYFCFEKNRNYKNLIEISKRCIKN